MKEKILPIIITVIGGLILVNLAVLDVGWLRQQKKQPAETVSSSTSPEIPTAPSSLPSGTCDALCQQMIEEKISQAVATLSGKETIKETETKVVEKTTTQTVSQPQVIYIPLGGSGSTTATDWTDVASAEVYLDLKDYPNLKEARFEGFIKVLHGNGKVYARLYDVTHTIGVQGSNIEGTSSSFSQVGSDPLALWQGKNLYRVQIKSLNGYEASFDSGRIKLILK